MPLALVPLLLFAQAPPPPPMAPPPPTWKATSPVGAPSTFEVASVKTNKSETAMGHMDLGPGKLNLTVFTLEGLVTWAYGVKDYQIVSAPPWFRVDRYDVNAKAYGAPDFAHLKLLLQTLLADRFKLTLHRETRQLPVFQLSVNGKVRMRPSSGPIPPDAPQIGTRGWNPDETDPNGLTIFTALKEQLGLKLESAKGPVEVLVIDHAERTPTPN